MIKYIRIYDLIGFKICWIACAFSTTWGAPYLGPLLTLIFILLHLVIVKFNSRDIKIIGLALLSGLVIDSLFFQFNLINYQGGILTQFKLAPLWILSMWAGFSVTLLYSLDSIKNRYFISGILGLIGGPLSYNAGVQIGSITLNGLLSYIALGIVWGLIIPILFYCINQLETNA
tara:strand:+ start:458 stop:979 length:522 start_codon:yes stop_codon:yes gene_type:complete